MRFNGIMELKDMLKNVMSRVLKNIDHVEVDLQADVVEHKRTHDHDVTRDYIDAFISKMKEDGDSETTFTDLQLIKVVGDLFVAGTETSSTTVRWALLYMIHHPELQDKIRKTIEENSEGELLSLNDRKALVLVDATLNEVLRLANIIAAGVPHQTSQELAISGFRIPANTTIMSNFWKIHFNPEAWTDPQKFDPSRFIDSEGKLIRPDAFMPFSVGNRACVGESLAKMEIFLFFGCLLKRFRFEPADPSNLPTLAAVDGFVRAPLPFKIRAVKIA